MTLGIAGIALAFLVSTSASALAAGRTSFGIVPQDGALPSGADLDLMPDGGITRIRTILAWNDVERQEGTYDWTRADQFVREATARGIRPLFFLYGSPAWAAARDHRNCASESECVVYPPKSKNTRAAYAEFAAAAVDRYGPDGDFWRTPAEQEYVKAVARLDDTASEAKLDICPLPLVCDTPPPPPPPDPVPDPSPPATPVEPPCHCTTPLPIRSWQIWNEQNSPKYFAPKPNVHRYALMLESASAAIRAADPNADVILGGMWGPDSAKHIVMPVTRYLDQLYGFGAGDDFDEIAIHPYADNARESLRQLQAASRTVRRAGDDAGTWVTEIGWAGTGPADHPYVKGLKGQARVLSKALTSFKRHRRTLGLRAVFWYSWRDKRGGKALCDWCGHAGLRKRNGSPKPAWRAFVRVARG